MTIMNVLRSEERLRAEKQISLLIGQTLEWKYYCYVKENPICFDWKIFIWFGQ